MQTSVIAFANQKGGVGKTTTTVNLAACVAARGKRVLIIDLDPQANATSGLGFEKEPGQSIYGPLLGEGLLVDKIKPTEMKKLDILPGEVDLAGAEIDVARADRYLHRFKEALAPLIEEGRYHFVFVDCPPSLGILTMNALTAADAVIIPLQCEYYALEGLTVMTRLIEQLSESGANPNLSVEGIVLTMYDARTNLSQQVVQEVLAHFGDKIYEGLIPRSVRLSEAPSYGKPIITYDKHSTGAAAYKQLAREFLARWKQRSEVLPPVQLPPEAVAQAPVPAAPSETLIEADVGASAAEPTAPEPVVETTTMNTAPQNPET